MFQTELTYLSEPDNFLAKAEVLECSQDERGPYLVFDKTIFYPQGGGQPFDTGSVTIDGLPFAVVSVRSHGLEVRHYINQDADTSNISRGQEATLAVDAERRKINSQAHTAGHLVDYAFEMLDIRLEPGKGHHFPGECNVEYIGEMENPDEWIPKLNEVLKSIIEEDVPVQTQLISYELISSYFPGNQFNITEGQPLRLVKVGRMDPMPCGGTHIQSSKELPSVTITKIKSKKGTVKVSYQVG